MAVSTQISFKTECIKNDVQSLFTQVEFTPIPFRQNPFLHSCFASFFVVSVSTIDFDSQTMSPLFHAATADRSRRGKTL